MKNICLTFQVHQPYRLRNFHFFEIGNHYNYFDEEANARIVRQVSEHCYLPANELLLNMIHTYGSKIKVSFAISGTVLDQIEQYEPHVLQSFKELSATGNVEFLGQTYATSLSSLKSQSAFHYEVTTHKRCLFRHFGKRPKVFLNTGLLYSDTIGKMISDMGFKGVITEGISAILDGKSPNYLYQSTSRTPLNLLLRNKSLSEDIAHRFSHRNWSEWPLTADKYLGWLNAPTNDGQVINLVMDYGTFGEHHKKETGILDFLEYLLRYLAGSKDVKLSTPKEVLRTLSSKGKIKVPKPVSWASTDKNASAWLGNEMQQEAFDTLYAMEDSVKSTGDKLLYKEWERLESADHFLYMNNQDEAINRLFNPYESPYDAFLIYMNVLSDFELKIQDKHKTRAVK